MTTSRQKGRQSFVGGLIPPSHRKTSATAARGSEKSPFYKPLPTRFRHNGLRLPANCPQRGCGNIRAALDWLRGAGRLLRGNSDSTARRISDQRKVYRAVRDLSE